MLHLLNSPGIHAKLSHEAGTIARLVGRLPDDAALVEELYLTFYSRLPDARERGAGRASTLRRDPAQRRQAAEDLAWSLMNSLEFLFNH